MASLRSSILLLLTLVSCGCLLLCVEASTEATGTLGVAPSDLGFYGASEFQCRDGSGKLQTGQVNDDYCDCPDGSDEPGTPACSPLGQFYCRNRGYKGEYIPSSHVRDGICDCCDGSDELGGTCENICLAKGKRYREEKRAEIETHLKGAEKRAQYVAEAQAILKDREAKRGPLQAKIEDLREKSTDLNAAKTEMERNKKLAEEVLQKAKEAEEAAKKASEEAEVKSEGEATEEQPSHHEASDDETPNSHDSESESEELETYENVVEGDDDDYAEEDGREGEEEGEEEEEDTENDHFEDEKNKVSEEDLETFKKTIAEAGSTPEAIVKEYELLSDEVRKLKDEIRSLDRELEELKEDDNQNFGKDLEFFYLKSKCFESKSVEYTYKVCPFGSANQDSTNLGRFHAITTDEEKEHVIMEFTEGTKCWGGPARSISVRLVCGLEEHLRDVEEPSRCAYAATLSTPAVCSKEYALKLRHDLQEGGVLLDDDVIPFF